MSKILTSKSSYCTFDYAGRTMMSKVIFVFSLKNKCIPLNVELISAMESFIKNNTQDVD